MCSCLPPLGLPLGMHFSPHHNVHHRRLENNAGWQCGVEKRDKDPIEEQENVSEYVQIDGALDYNPLDLSLASDHSLPPAHSPPT